MFELKVMSKMMSKMKIKNIFLYKKIATSVYFTHS